MLEVLALVGYIGSVYDVLILGAGAQPGSKFL